jgi:hypothetical protein
VTETRCPYHASKKRQALIGPVIDTGMVVGNSSYRCEMPNWFSRRTSLRAPSVLNSDYRPGFVQAAASLSSGALTRTKGAGRAVGREKGRKTVMPIRTRRFGPWALHCPKNGAVARPSDQASIVARRGFYFHSIGRAPRQFARACRGPLSRPFSPSYRPLSACLRWS